MPSTRWWSRCVLLGVTAAGLSGAARAQPTPKAKGTPPASTPPAADANTSTTAGGATALEGSPATRTIEAAPDSEPGLIARAKSLFARGATAYSAGRYYEAIEIFTEANRLYPNPQFSFNIAKAYDNLGSHSGALRFYLEYLRRSPEAPDRLAVEARLRELEVELAKRGVQQLTVLSEPAEAMVYLDGHPVGLTPWTGETWPGKHSISLRRQHYDAHETTIELERLRSTELNVTLERVRPPVAPRVVDARLRWEQTHHTSALTWICFGTAAAALGTAITIEATIGGESRKLEPSTAFFAGLGAASAAVGGVLLYFDLSTDDAQKQKAPSAAPATALTLGVTRGGGVASYHATF
jgi:tetratricopeptide (TPR) repeat protein